MVISISLASFLGEVLRSLIMKLRAKWAISESDESLLNGIKDSVFPTIPGTFRFPNKLNLYS